MINEQNVKNFCKDDISLIQNYEQAINDNTLTWDCHHRLELHPDNSVRFTRNSLIKLDLYYNRPAGELIFLTHAEHMSMHHKGKVKSDDTKQKMSEAHKGKIGYWTGKKRAPFSEEHRAKMSESAKKRWALCNDRR